MKRSLLIILMMCAVRIAFAQSVSTSDNYGYLVIKTRAVEGATVFIDGKEMEMKTPFMSDSLKAGPHKIKIIKEGYNDYSAVLPVEANKTKTFDIRLKQPTPTNPYRRAGLVLLPEINASMVSNYGVNFANMAITPQMTLEYMFKSTLGFGIGTGYLCTNANLHSIPLFAQLSIYYTNSKISPYLNLKLGYNFKIDHNNFGPGSIFARYYFRGIFEVTSIGININHSRIGLSIGLYQYEHEVQRNNIHELSTGDKLFYGITYSYMIYFKKK